MSGGSYNYLCYKSADSLLEQQEELRGMQNRLSQLGLVEAAKETGKVLKTLEEALKAVEKLADNLHGVWHAVEWYDSGDWGKDDLNRIASQYKPLPETQEPP